MGENVQLYINWSSALFALIAAIFWYKSSVAKIEARNRPGGGQIIVGKDDKKWDLIPSLVLQAAWSKRAALMASVAAALQAISLMIK